MSIKTVLRTPEFPINQPILIRFPTWNKFKMGIIYPSSTRLQVITKDGNWYQVNKRMFQFENTIFSAYTEGVQVKMLNGKMWRCWDKVFVPKAN